MNVIEEFHASHANVYGHAMEDRPIEIVNMRLQAIGDMPKPEFTPEGSKATTAEEAYLGDKKSPFGGIMALYERDALAPGARFGGEALVFQFDSTVYIARGWSARVDGYRNLILERL
jgi:N-methylhydantoinase A